MENSAIKSILFVELYQLKGKLNYLNALELTDQVFDLIVQIIQNKIFIKERITELKTILYCG